MRIVIFPERKTSTVAAMIADKKQQTRASSSRRNKVLLGISLAVRKSLQVL